MLRLPPRDDEAPKISADKARGGDIVPRGGWERGVFIAGLAGAVILGLVIAAPTYRR